MSKTSLASWNTVRGREQAYMEKPDIVERLRETACIPDGRGGTVWRPPIMEEAAKEIERLREQVGRGRWRPISEMHEDFGPCVLMHFAYPGCFHVGSNLEDSFEWQDWSIFVPVPSLTSEEAERLRAAQDVAVAEGN